MIQDINYYRAISNATGCNTKTETQKAQIKRRLKRDFENPLMLLVLIFITQTTILGLKFMLKSLVKLWDNSKNLKA